MPLSSKLFRESALERLSSPEQLDRLLQVTSPRGWLSLVAIWALLAMVIVWTIVGIIPTKERGKGILVVGGGLKLVVATGSGRLASIDVKVDESIEAGQVVARIDKQDLDDQVKEAVEQLDELRKQHTRLVDFENAEDENQDKLEAEETARLEKVIAFAQRRHERLQARRKITQKQFDLGNVIEIDVFKVDEEIEATIVAIERSELEKQQLIERNRTASFERDRGRIQRVLEIDVQDRNVKTLRDRLKRESQVKSEFSGQVIELRVAAHTAVTMGQPLMLVAPVETGAGALEAVLYVPATTGNRIERGMEVRLSPSTVEAEEYGTLLGTVRSIAAGTTSREAMMRVLADRDLVDQFTREIGIVKEMWVTLQTADTPSGYAWTSLAGPPIQISAGTLCEGSVTVDRRSPLSFVIPTKKGSPDAE